ncbi:unnamed protein product [Brassicogethes aeneus]|uniref:UDP-glucuronosyltransferase n=1 Tax=Brassicogethes aeneus TaxID=1431903 RepID=A0A9P0AVJ8_BRAAE|nr:unnamed protein product [Brassicogethes aeneus]
MFNMRLVLLLFLFKFSSSSNILGVFVVPSKSHHRALYPIFEKLAEQGHNITVITAFPKFNKSLNNFHEVDISFTREIYLSLMKKYYTRPYADTSSIDIMSIALRIFTEIFEEVIALKHVRDLIDNKFDVLMVETVIPLAFFVGIKNKAPIIGISSLPGILYTHDSLGNPSHPVLSPNFILQMTEDSPTFYERLTSVMFNTALRFYYKLYITHRSDIIARKFFGDDVPSLSDIEKNMSLAFVTRNWVTNEISPNVPNIVDISLIQIKPKKALPKDIQDFLDKSKRGVVYFSMGTNEPTYEMCKHKIEMIKDALLSLPYDVLWKSDINITMSNNIMVKNWFPQNDILAHPNLRVFISQGGSHSLEEAVLNAVPLVLLPVYADQGQNSRRISSKGMAEKLDIFTVTKEELAKTIIKVAETKRYRINALKLSKIIKDQPMKGVEKAVWWVEYVMRHKGARHLRSGFVDMPFYQYYLLDVMGFIGLLVVVIIFAFYKTLCCFKNLCRLDEKCKLQ